MSINNFYDFGSKLVLANATFSPKNINFENDIFAERRLIQGEYEGFQFPIICVHDQGKNMRDVLDTGYVSLFLISDRLKEILVQNHITGWKSYPVKLIDKNGNEVTGYHGFSITGRCGPIDYSRSKIIERRFVPDGPLCKFYKGTYIDLDKWDGSDFFLIEGTVKIVVTENTAKILKTNKISNVYLLNLAEEETRDFIVN